MNNSEYDVLFVDDDPNILKAIKRNLYGKYNVCVADSVHDAVELLEKNLFPVVFSDMKMPQMSGADFLIMVKEKNPDSVRVLLTGESDLADAIKAINESDIYKILLKPCSPESICTTINSALKLYHANKLEEILMDKSLKGFVLIVLDLLKTISPEVFKRSTDITKIFKSPRTKFELKEPWSFEVTCLLMYLGSIHLRIYNFDQIYGTENMVKVIRKSASLLVQVPKFEAVYNNLNDLADYYSKSTVINKLDSDSKILKLIVDYHSLVKDSNVKQKLRLMYSKEIIAQLPSLFGKKAQEKAARELKAGEIKAGMVTADDILSKSGSIILFKGETITEQHVSTLMIFSEKEYLIEPLKIVEV